MLSWQTARSVKLRELLLGALQPEGGEKLYGHSAVLQLAFICGHLTGIAFVICYYNALVFA